MCPPRACRHSLHWHFFANRDQSDIPLVLTAYTLWKLFKRTKIHKLSDIPLEEALERAAQDPGVEKRLPGWRRIVGFLWD
jgi:yeast amino acid transporter